MKIVIGTGKNQDEKEGPRVGEVFDRNYFGRNNVVSTSLKNNEFSASPLLQRPPQNITDCKDHQRLVFSDPFPNLMNSSHLVKDSSQPCPILPIYNRYALPVSSNPWPDTANTVPLLDQNQILINRHSREFNLGEEDSPILWHELLLREKIGSGTSCCLKLHHIAIIHSLSPNAMDFILKKNYDRIYR